MNDERHSVFRDAGRDRETAEQIPDTPQTRAPSYRLAFADEGFLCRDEKRTFSGGREGEAQQLN